MKKTILFFMVIMFASLQTKGFGLAVSSSINLCEKEIVQSELDKWQKETLNVQAVLDKSYSLETDLNIIEKYLKENPYNKGVFETLYTFLRKYFNEEEFNLSEHCLFQEKLQKENTVKKEKNLNKMIKIIMEYIIENEEVLDLNDKNRALIELTETDKNDFIAKVLEFEIDEDTQLELTEKNKTLLIKYTVNTWNLEERKKRINVISDFVFKNDTRWQTIIPRQEYINYFIAEEWQTELNAVVNKREKKKSELKTEEKQKKYEKVTERLKKTCGTLKEKQENLKKQLTKNNNEKDFFRNNYPDSIIIENIERQDRDELYDVIKKSVLLKNEKAKKHWFKQYENKIQKYIKDTGYYHQQNQLFKEVPLDNMEMITFLKTKIIHKKDEKSILKAFFDQLGPTLSLDNKSKCRHNELLITITNKVKSKEAREALLQLLIKDKCLICFLDNTGIEIGEDFFKKALCPLIITVQNKDKKWIKYIMDYYLKKKEDRLFSRINWFLEEIIEQLKTKENKKELLLMLVEQGLLERCFKKKRGTNEFVRDIVSLLLLNLDKKDDIKKILSLKANDKKVIDIIFENRKDIKSHPNFFIEFFKQSIKKGRQDFLDIKIDNMTLFEYFLMTLHKTKVSYSYEDIFDKEIVEKLNKESLQKKFMACKWQEILLPDQSYESMLVLNANLNLFFKYFSMDSNAKNITLEKDIFLDGLYQKGIKYTIKNRDFKFNFYQQKVREVFNIANANKIKGIKQTLINLYDIFYNKSKREEKIASFKESLDQNDFLWQHYFFKGLTLEDLKYLILTQASKEDIKIQIDRLSKIYEKYYDQQLLFAEEKNIGSYEWYKKELNDGTVDYILKNV